MPQIIVKPLADLQMEYAEALDAFSESLEKIMAVGEEVNYADLTDEGMTAFRLLNRACQLAQIAEDLFPEIPDNTFKG